MTAPIRLEEVVADPHGVAERLLEAGIYGLTNVHVALADGRWTIFWLTLEPWADMADLDYPIERVSILMHRDGSVRAVPLDHKREWLHILPGDLPELCLWFPGDPPGLRWSWENGLVEYITIVHRHLQAEECWRRRNIWPGEDTPHGPGPHPVSSAELRWVASRGA